MIGVLAPGALTLIEDGGRRGHMRCGVSRAGAMDRTALFHANMLVGNGETEGALEATLTTPELCFGDDALFAVTGGRCAPLLDGERVPMDTAVRARPGQTLSSSPVAPGCRAYFAFAGGLGLHGALGAQVFKTPDARFMGRIAVQRAARDMAPEDFAVGTLHDAVVGVVALGVENGLHVRAQALILVCAWIQYLERLADEDLARSAKHLADVPVAVDHGAVA